MLKDYTVADDSYYLFTCAELKEKEKEFIEKQKIKRMLDTKSIDSFFKLLHETYYSKYINDISKNNDLESIITSELKSIVNFLKKRLKPEHQIIISFLMHKEDLHNIKIIMKSEILNRDLEELFVPILYSYNQLKEAVETESYENIDLDTSLILQYASMLSHTEKIYRTAELKLELFFLEKLYSSVTTLKSRMLEDFTKHIIDIFNIKNIYRNKFAGEKFDFDLFLHKNGFLTINFLKKFENENLDYFVQEVGRTQYAPLLVQETFSLFNDSSTSYSFEKSEEIFYICFFDSIKYTISNMEKIVDFFIKKKIEIMNLNIIFTGILYNIDRDKIRHEVLIFDEDKSRCNW